MDIKEAELIFQNAAINLSKEKLHFHTIQFLIKEESQYVPYGSGVLIHVGTHYLICTASHVTEDMPQIPLYINTNLGVRPLSGTFRQTDRRLDKHTDISYIILDASLALLITKTYKFLGLTRISHSHIPKETTNYMVSGYPAKNIWVVGGNTITGSSHFLLSMANEKAYKYYKLDPIKQFALTFAGRGFDLTTNQKTEKIGDPYGISGCGLWFLQVRPIVGKMVLDYFLIGIMTHFKKTKYHILIGNKIEIILADLEENDFYRFDWNKVS